MKPSFILAASCALLLACGLPAQEIFTWSGAGDGNWASGANWAGGTAPNGGGNDVLTFTGLVGLAANNNIGGYAAHRLIFDVNAGAFTLGGNAVTLGGLVGVAPRVANDSAALQTLNLALTLNGTTATDNLAEVLATGGDLAFAQPVDLSGVTQLTVNPAALRTVTFGGAITSTGNGGTNRFRLAGAGTVNFNAVNTYTGATEVFAGTLQLGAGGGIDASSTVTLGDTAAPTVSAALLLADADGGATFTSPITVGAGDGANRTLGGTNFSGINTFLSPIALAAGVGEDRTLTVTAALGGEVQFNGAISGAGQGLRKTGGGLVSLRAVNSYTGPTRVLEGTLQVGIGGALAAASAVSVGDPLAPFTPAAFLLGDPVGGQAYAGAIVIEPGSLANRTVGAANTAGTSTFSGAIQLGGGAGEDRSVTLTAAAGGTVQFDGAISGAGQSVVKAGAGTVQLNALNTYTGGTTVNAGTLRLGNTEVLADTGPLTVTGGTFNLNGLNETVGPVVVTGGTVSSGVAVLTAASYAVEAGTISANLAGPGGLAKNGAGTATLSGVNVFTGGVGVNLGQLNAATDATLGDAANAIAVDGGALNASASFSTARAILLANNAGNRLRVSTNMTLTATGAISGPGGFEKPGAGTLVLGAGENVPNTFAGTTTVSLGTLQLNKAPGTNALGAGNVVVIGGDLRIVASEQIPDTALLTVSGGTVNGTGGTATAAETIAALEQTAGALSSGDNPAGFVITGTANVTGGTVTINSAGTLKAKLLKLANATLSLSGNSDAAPSVVEVGSDGLELDTATVNLNGTATAGTRAGSVFKLGGPLTATGTANFVRQNAGQNITSTLDLTGGVRTFSIAGATALGAANARILVANGGLTKTGAGALTLTGGTAAGAFAGGLAVLGGVVNFDTDTALGALTNALTLDAGTLTLTATTGTITVNDNAAAPNTKERVLTIGPAGGTLDVPTIGVRIAFARTGGLAGTGPLTKAGGGLLTISGTNVGLSSAITLAAGGIELQANDALGTGLVTVSGGTLITGNATVANGVVVNSGTLGVENGTTGSIFAGPITAAGDFTIALQDFVTPTTERGLTISGPLSGAATITVGGTANNTRPLLLTNAGNTFSGTFSVGGTQRLRAQPVSALGAANIVLNTGTLELRDNGAGNDGTIVNGNDVSVTGTPVTIDVNNAGANTGNTIQLGDFAIGAHTLNVTGGNGYKLSFGGATMLTGAPTFNITTADLTLGGPVSGAFGFTKNGTGKLTLGSANTYTGNTNVSAGVLQFNHPTVNGAANGTISVPFAATVAAGFPIDQPFLAKINSGSAGVVALAADSPNTLDLASANLVNMRLGAVGTATLSGNIAPVGANFRLGGGGGTLVLSATNALIGANGLDLGVNGTAPGVVALTATNSFTGAINLREGMLLRPQTSASLGNAANVVTGDGGGIQFAKLAPFDLFATRTVVFGGNGFILHTNDNDYLPSGAITSSGGGPFIKAGGGTLTLAAPNAYSGTTQINGGALAVDADAKFGNSNNLIFGGGTLRWIGPSGTFGRGGNFLDVANAGTIEVPAGITLTLSGSYGGGGVGKTILTKTGAGTLIPNAGSGFGGDVVINQGTLQITSGGPDGTLGNGAKLIVVQNGATFSLTGASYDPGGNTKHFSFGPGGGVLHVGTGITLSLNDGTAGAGIVTNASQLQGTGTLTKTGDGILELGNTASANYNYANFTGEIVIAQGIVRTRGASSPHGAASAGTTVLPGGALETRAVAGLEPVTIHGDGTGVGAINNVSNTNTASFDGPITVASAASIGVTGSQAITFNGPILGSAQLTKTGTGAGGVTFTAANPFTGNLRSAGGVAMLTGANGAFLNASAITGLSSGVFLLNNDGGVDVTTANNPDRFADTTPVTLGHGVIELRPLQAATGASSETLGPVTTTGHAVLKISRTAGAATATLTAQSLTRAGRAVLRLQNAATGTLGGLDKIIVANNPPVPVNGMLAPWIVNDTERTFVTYGANGFENTPFTSNDANSAGPTGIVDITTGFTLAPNRSVYAIRLSGGSLATPETLTVVSGGVMTTATTTHVASFAFPAGVEGLLYTAGGVTTTFSGAFNAPAGLTKFGTGFALLTGTNTANLAGPITVSGGVLSFGLDNNAGNNQGYFPATGFLHVNDGGTANFFSALTIGGLGGAGTVMWGNTAAQVKREITLANQTANTFSGTLQRSSIAGAAGGGTAAGEALFTKAGAGTLTLDGSAFLNGIRELKVFAGNLTFAGNSRWTPQNERGRLAIAQGAVATLDNTAVNLPDRLALDYNSNSELGGAFRLAGGTFRFLGNASANSTETLTRLPATVTAANYRPTFGAGADVIEILPGAGRAAVLGFLTLSGTTDLSFVRESGASVLIRGTNLGAAQGAADTATLLLSSAPTLTGAGGTGGALGTPTVGVMRGVIADSVVGGADTYGLATYDRGADLVFGNADDPGVRRLLAGEHAALVPDGDVTTLPNVLLAAAQSLANASAVNALHLAEGAVLTGASTLTVNSGTILATGASQLGLATLAFGANEAIVFTAGTLDVAAAITGSAGLTKGGPGTLTLSNAANAFTGTLTVNGGLLALAANGALGAAANALTLNNGGGLSATATFALNNGSGTNRAVALGAAGGVIHVASGAQLTVSGGISGGVTALSALDPAGTTALTKSGLGTLLLTGANTYLGVAAVNAGTFTVGDGTSGSLAGGVAVNAGGTLAGRGTITGAVAVNDDGTLAPGPGAATLNAGGLRMNDGATFALDLSSASAFDQMNVTGAVTLTGEVDLAITLGYDPIDNVDSFLIVQNDGSDAVFGGFFVGGTGIADGGFFNVGGQEFMLRYTLGTGNDVVLLAVPEPSSAAILSAGLALLGLRRRRVSARLGGRVR